MYFSKKLSIVIFSSLGNIFGNFAQSNRQRSYNKPLQERKRPEFVSFIGLQSTS
jgi:hypothetical protein